MTTFYFTITTITTVGYGDFSPGTFAEKLVGCMLMFIGVLTFSFASGSLATYFSSQDEISAALEAKMVVLDKIYLETNFPADLYTKIKNSLKFNATGDITSTNEFIEGLPSNLRTDLTVYVYEDVYMKVDFLKTKHNQFINWICPLLRP